MDPITILFIGAGIYLATRKPKKKRTQARTNLPSGHYELAIGEELTFKLPRDTGYWTETGIGGTPGDVKIWNKGSDPLTMSRIEGLNAGPLKIQYYADPEKTDLVGEYSLQVLGTHSAHVPPGGDSGRQTASLKTGLAPNQAG